MKREIYILFVAILICILLVLPSFSSEKIVFSLTDPVKQDSAIFIMDPEGAKVEKIFDFYLHPKHPTGSIYDVRLSGDGRMIYFSSNNAFAYTPFSTNIFRVTSDGSWIDQITPDSNSGKWEEGCPCGTVKGKVLKPSTKEPWGGCPVFLEGKKMVYSQEDGTFVFDKVPIGVRFIVAYRPGSMIYDAKPISVFSKKETTITLIPNNNYRTGFYKPIPVGKRIYFRFGQSEVKWTGEEATFYHNIYTAKGACTGVPDIDGFDVNEKTGTIAIMDYQTGCTTNRGVYITDIDGKNLSLFWDMKTDNKFSDGGEVFWSHNGRMLLTKVSYNSLAYFVLIDAENKKFLSSFSFPKNYTIHDLTLFGFSPSDDWVLFSYRLPNTDKWVLTKMKIGENGVLDANSLVSLFKSTILTGATWGILNPPSSPPEGAIRLKKR